MKLLFSITTLKCLFVYDMEDEYKMVSRQDLGWYVWYRYTETAVTGDDDSPPLVVATAVAAAAADSTLLPIVAEAINLSKFASSTPPTTQQQQAGGLPVTATLALGRFPAALSTCPICHRSQITTRIRTYPSCETWTMVTTLFLVFWPICWIPLVVDSSKMTDHYCTICSENVGTVKPMTDCCDKEMG